MTMEKVTFILILLQGVLIENNLVLSESSMEDNRDKKFIANDTPFAQLDASQLWNGLSEKQKLYTHYMARASWEGHPINFVQTSPESPLIFVLLYRLLHSKPTLSELGEHLIAKHGFTKEDVTCLITYSAAFFTYGGNYRSFGDSKFIPCLAQDKLASAAREVLKEEDFRFYELHCLQRMYDFVVPVRQIAAFPPRGLTTYFSANCNETDAQLLVRFLAHMNMDAYNHRVFKTVAPSGLSTYEIRFASSQPTEADLETEEKTKDGKKLIGSQEEFEGNIFKFTRGDYGQLLGAVNKELENAIPHAFNENQTMMLKLFRQSFETGSLNAHKDGNRYWIKDKKPAVESHLGFIESYRDPAGARSSFEGFAAAVNAEESAVLTKLVDGAPKLIHEFLPWPKEFEKDRFLAPDFTSLDIVAFAGYTVYLGINLPNYDGIRQNEGFKNVHLGNVAKAMGFSKNFLSAEGVDLMSRYGLKAQSAQTIFHELLGHGSGKLFKQNPDGTYNFDRNVTSPLTGKPVTSWYKSGQTWNTLFGSISTTIEECRAECVGMLLSAKPEALTLIGVLPDELANVTRANWLSMGLKGLQGLQSFSAASEVWGQAHARARFVILRVLMEKLPELFRIEKIVRESDGQPDLRITLNSELIPKGEEALAKLLLQIQVYKSTADVEALQKLYLEYSNPRAKAPTGDSYLDLKKIIDARVKEKTILVQPNTVLRDGSSVDLVNYEASAEGAVKSFLERFGNNPENLHTTLKELYLKDLPHFPLPT